MKLNVLNRDIKEAKDKLRKIKNAQMKPDTEAKISIICKLKQLENTDTQESNNSEYETQVKEYENQINEINKRIQK